MAALSTMVVSTTPFLVGCHHGTSEREDLNFDITSDGNNYGFSNNLMEDIPYITLSFNIDGTIKEGDTLLTYISNQKVDHIISNNLDIADVSKEIVLNKDQNHFDIRIEKLSFIPNDIFIETFSLTFKLLRDETAVLVKTIDNNFFYNATPISPEMLDISSDINGQTILKGFVKDPSVREQLLLCNLLIIPDEVGAIDTEAFYENNSRYPHTYGVFFLLSRSRGDGRRVYKESKGIGT